MTKYISTLLFSLLITLSFAQSNQEITNLFGTIENRPGGIIGIIEDGKIAYRKGFGLANLDYDIPITPKTVFDIGSVSKQFTATCIFLLEQQGKLSIDDPIQKYLPEMPVFHKEKVTIRHLLNHTSGLRDYVEITAYAGIPFENIFTEEMGLDILTRQKERSFPPGQQFMYNNGGYLLLAIIIRRASGLSIGTFAQQHIFEPLGMKNTFILENPHRIVKNSATGYAPVNDSLYEKRHYYNIALGGDGQVYTTLEDLLLWDNNFYDKKVGGQALFDRQHERGIISNGDTIEYAGGLFVQENKGYRVVQHTGAWGGFRTVFYRLPTLKKTLVVLANTPDFLNGPKFFGLIDLIIPTVDGIQKKENKTTTAAAQLATKQLQSYTGIFAVIGQPHLRLQSKAEKDTLVITQLWDKQAYQLIPTSKNEFFRKDNPIVRYVFDEKTGIPVIHERLEVWDMEKVEAYQSALDTSLEEYTGKYYSAEVGVTYSIEAIDNQLVVIRNKEKIKTLLPVSEDVFGNNVQGYQFIRKAGKINRFLMQDRRIRNLEFLKK